jgi:hypothetical protein
MGSPQPNNQPSIGVGVMCTDDTFFFFVGPTLRPGPEVWHVTCMAGARYIPDIFLTFLRAVEEKTTCVNISLTRRGEVPIVVALHLPEQLHAPHQSADLDLQHMTRNDTPHDCSAGVARIYQTPYGVPRAPAMHVTCQTAGPQLQHMSQGRALGLATVAVKKKNVAARRVWKLWTCRLACDMHVTCRTHPP